MSQRGLDWYKRYPISFLDGVQGLGPDLIGAYAVLLDLIYARGGKTMRDDRHLAGLLGCSPRLAKSLTDRLIAAGKISVRDGFVTNSRAETQAKRRRTEREARANAQRKSREREGDVNENNRLPDKTETSEAPLEEERDKEKSKRPPKSPRGDEDLSPNLFTDRGGGKDPPKTQPTEIEEAVQSYNTQAEKSAWPQCQKLTKSRASKLRARLQDVGGLLGWQSALEKAAASDFLCNRADRSFTASFDFLLQETSFTKLMEGNYDNRVGSRTGDRNAGIGRALEEVLRERDQRIPVPE